MPFGSAVSQWQEGQRRLDAATTAQRTVLDRIHEAIVAELRRRLGSSFTTEELVELYDRGTDWCLAIAVSRAPDDPAAWDARTAVDAAFARYLREASDYAGGRRTGAPSF